MDALAEQMPSRLFGEWRAFYGLEPRGELRADWRMAMQTAVLYNIQVKEKDRKKPEDFLLKFETEQLTDEQDSWKKLLATVEMLNAAMGGDDLRQKGEDG